MSAYIVSAETIADSVAAIRESGLDLPADYASLSDRSLGIVLWHMNATAYCARYSEDVAAYEDLVFAYAAPEASKNAMQRLKSLMCFGYQCAEGDVPDSVLYQFCAVVEGACAMRLSGATTAERALELSTGSIEYNALQWGRS